MSLLFSKIKKCLMVIISVFCVIVMAGALLACQESPPAAASPTPEATPKPIYNELISVEWDGITLELPDTCVLERDENLFTATVEADGQTFFVAISSVDTVLTSEDIASSEEYAQLFRGMNTAQASEFNIDAEGFTKISGMTVPYVSFTGVMNAKEGTAFFEAQTTTNACTFINGEKQYIFVVMHHTQNSHGFQSLTKNVIDSIIVLHKDIIDTVEPEADTTLDDILTTELESETAYVDGMNINMRSGPGTEFDVVKKVSAPDSFLILDKTEDWYHINLDGIDGYLQEDFVSFEPTKPSRSSSGSSSSAGSSSGDASSGNSSSAGSSLGDASSGSSSSGGSSSSDASSGSSSSGGWDSESKSSGDASSKPSSSGGTVYWVSGGKVYHSTSNCVSLARSSNIKSGTVAQSGKSRACKNCH